MKTYAVISKDDVLLFKSSSGAAFTLFAQQVLADSGVVFGVAMVDDCESAHFICAETMSELQQIRTSKYIQADIGDVYYKVENMLQDGRKVLFTGTPCQIAGLHKYLGKCNGNLITISIACYGTPQKKIWQLYKTFLEQKYHSVMTKVNFRYKTIFSTQNIMVEFLNGKKFVKASNEDAYYRLFSRNYSIANRCYDCKFKKFDEEPDITLGDLWGAKTIVPDLDATKGISLVIVHSEKGFQYFNNLYDTAICKEINLQDALTYNPYIMKSVEMPSNRDDFLKDCEELRFDKLADKYAPIGKRARIKLLMHKIYFLLNGKN